MSDKTKKIVTEINKLSATKGWSDFGRSIAFYDDGDKIIFILPVYRKYSDLHKTGTTDDQITDWVMEVLNVEIDSTYNGNDIIFVGAESNNKIRKLKSTNDKNKKEDEKMDKMRQILLDQLNKMKDDLPYLVEDEDDDSGLPTYDYDYSKKWVNKKNSTKKKKQGSWMDALRSKYL